MVNKMNSNEELDSIMKEFIDFSLEQKLDLLLNQLKEAAVTVKEMCNNYNSENEVYINRELVDINKENVTIDDYVEASEVYVLSILSSLNKFSEAEDEFLNSVSSLLPNKEEQ